MPGGNANRILVDEEGLLAKGYEHFRAWHDAGSSPRMIAYFNAMKKDRCRGDLLVESADDLDALRSAAGCAAVSEVHKQRVADVAAP